MEETTKTPLEYAIERKGIVRKASNLNDPYGADSNQYESLMSQARELESKMTGLTSDDLYVLSVN